MRRYCDRGVLSPSGEPMRRHGAGFVAALAVTFGAFLFARTTSTALHELGHGIPGWAAGASHGYIFFHPFAGGGYKFATDPGAAHVWSVAGGPIGGSILCLLPMLCAAPWRGPATLWAFMTPFIGCASNGAQLTVLLMLNRYDAASLVELGAPWPLVFACGAVILLIAAVCGLVCLPLMGIRAEDGVARRFVLLALVLIIYSITATAYSLAYGWTARVWLFLLALLPALALTWLIAWVSATLQRRLRWEWIVESPPVTWRAAGVNLVLGVGFAAAAMAVMAASPAWTAP